MYSGGSTTESYEFVAPSRGRGRGRGRGRTANHTQPRPGTSQSKPFTSMRGRERRGKTKANMAITLSAAD